ncbi:hypothetical protein KAH81_06565 [bacterium]|nr:hypothetical protein [bacterium]
MHAEKRLLNSKLPSKNRDNPWWVWQQRLERIYMALSIGHRGAAGHELENSMVSFQKAIELGSDMIEFDVRITKNGIPIIMHDRTLRRVTGRNGFVRAMSYENIKNIPLVNGENIPTLAEVCSFISEYNIKAYIEAKVRDRKGIIIGQALENMNTEDFYIGSFDRIYLELIKKTYPEVKTIAITNQSGDSIVNIIKTGIEDCLSIEYGSINLDIIQLAHSYNKEIFVWTVDDIEEIDRMKSFGVDGIVSDYPDKVKNAHPKPKRT